MSTIDLLANIDTIATRIIAALRRGVAWIEDKHEDCLVEATYKAVERKAAAIGKADHKISILEDSSYELAVQAEEARVLLREKHRAARRALEQELATKDEKIDAALAAAVLLRIAADKAYRATIQEADEKLGVKVEA